MSAPFEADCRELAAALGVSERAVQKRAKNEDWPHRDAVLPTGNKKRLYAIERLPESVAAAVRRARAMREAGAAAAAVLPAPTLVTSSAPATGALPAATPAAGLSLADIDLTDRQRLERDARAGVIQAIRRFQAQAGCSQEAAIQTLLTLAASGQAEPIVMQALRLARDARGRKGNGLPSARTVKRWLAAHDLTPRQPQRDMTVPPWAKVFLERYQRPQKPSLEAAYREACNAWAADERPSIHQVRRFLAKLGAVTREAGRMGPRELKSIRPFVRRDFSMLEPNDIWTADGHTFDAEVQHPFHGRPFRPEITTLVDIATRRIVGWSVALAESSFAVLDAIRSGVEENGLPAILYVDNGSGYANQLMKAEGVGLQARLGFEIKHSLPYNSQARGVIERLHKTVWVEGAKLLPSYVGAAMDREARLAQFKLTRQALKRGGAMPLIPWEVFLDFCRARVADYNARPHRTLKGVSPDLKWRDFELRGWQAHRLAAEDLETLFRPRVLRKLNRGEIQLFNNLYACPRLEEFHGETVQVAYDLHAPDKVWVYTPEGRFMGEALAHGNRKHYYPVAVTQQAREKRAAGRLKKVQAKAREIREELNGPALEAPAWQPLPAVKPAVPAPAPSRSSRPIAEVVDEWLALDARLRAGEAVTEDEAYWHGSVQKSPAWRAEMKRRESEREGFCAPERRAAG